MSLPCVMPSLLVSLSHTPAAALLLAQHKKCQRKVKAFGTVTSPQWTNSRDIYAKGTGLLWSNSKEEFDGRVQLLMDDWQRLESSEGKEPEFVEYFRKFK